MKHFEFLVEDLSGKVMLDLLLKNVIPNNVTYKVYAYRGIGRIPKGLTPKSDASKRIFLDQLPRLIAGYGRAFAKDMPTYSRSVVIVCDLDDRDRTGFENEIYSIINICNPKPDAILCIAIEEGEAWLLGDIDAIILAYPKANRNEILRYTPDSICGTWEFMADLLEKGGAQALKKFGYQAVGRAKYDWAVAISPRIDPVRNRSPSFQEFVQKLGKACI